MRKEVYTEDVHRFTVCSMKKKQSLHPDIFLVAGLFVFIIFLAGLIGYSLAASLQKTPVTMICSEEQKVCPGGSKVNRTGPTCEFSPCPSSTLPNRQGIVEEPFLAPPASPLPTPPKAEKSKKDPILCTQEVKMCEDGSLVGKTGPNCEFAPCPDGLEIDSDR